MTGAWSCQAVEEPVVIASRFLGYFEAAPVSRFRNIEPVARRKLLQSHAATELAGLLAPPGNQLEALKADRRASTAFSSTTRGGSVSPGGRPERTTSISPMLAS